MKKNKLLFLFIIFLLSLVFIPISYGDKVEVQFPQVYNGIQIVYPKIDYHTFGEDFELHFHAFNGSYHVLNDSSTQCKFSLHNNGGEHVAHYDPMPIKEDHIFYAFINKSNITSIGQYSFIVHCNNTFGEAGFVSDDLLITYDGTEPENNLFIIIFGMLIMGFFFFSLGLMTKGLGAKITCFGVTLIQVISITFLIYLNEVNGNIVPFLQIHWVSMFIICAGLGVLALLMYAINTVNTDNEGNEGEDKWISQYGDGGDKKWGKKRK